MTQLQYAMKEINRLAASLDDYQHHDAKGRFVNARISNAVEYCLALEEHEEMDRDTAENVALANCGHDLTDQETDTFFEILGVI